jgi:hypothetical protein
LHIPADKRLIETIEVVNAARNIANLGIAEAGRLSVNEPNVASYCS